MSTQKLIAIAILGTDEDKETALRQITCNTAARTACFCECGNIHDEKKIHVVEVIHNDGTEQTMCAVCPECFKKHEPRLTAIAAKARKDYEAEKQTPPRLRVATWKKYFYLGEDGPKKPPAIVVRALSIAQIVANKEHSERAAGVFQGVYDRFGILTDAVMVIDCSEKPIVGYRHRKCEPITEEWLEQKHLDFKGYLQHPVESWIVTIDRTPFETSSVFSPVAFRLWNAQRTKSCAVSASRILTVEKFHGKRLQWLWDETNGRAYAMKTKTKTKNKITKAIAVIVTLSE